MVASTRAGDALIAALLLLPVLGSLPHLWPDSADSNTHIWFAARLSGIAALSAMLMAAALSARLPVLDRWLGGLPRIWNIHRQLGLWSFVLILLHVLLVALNALPLGAKAPPRALFPPFQQYPEWLGWLALALMLTFLAPTFQFFGRPPYQRWKRLHLLALPATLATLAHTWALTPHPAVWILPCLLAIAAMSWRKLLSPILGRHRYRITQRLPLAAGVVELKLSPCTTPMTYQSGQFIYLCPLDDTLVAGRGEEHPYTLSSSPHDDDIRIAIKSLGDATEALQTVSVGSEVQLEGPYGQFLRREHPARKQLWLGGGIGITPFVSGARTVAHNRCSQAITLIYLVNNPARAYYFDELESLARNNANLDVLLHDFSTHGTLTRAFINTHCPDFAEREIYICGPAGMQRHLLALLKQAGIAKRRIHTEAFDFL